MLGAELKPELEVEGAPLGVEKDLHESLVSLLLKLSEILFHVAFLAGFMLHQSLQETLVGTHYLFVEHLGKSLLGGILGHAVRNRLVRHA